MPGRKAIGRVKDQDFFRGRMQIAPDELSQVLEFMVIPVQMLPGNRVVIDVLVSELNKLFDIYPKDAPLLRKAVIESRRQARKDGYRSDDPGSAEQ